MTHIYIDFIKTLRKERELSQLEVALKLGISRSSYIALEQGKRELSLKEAGSLSEIFSISIQDLLEGKVSTPLVILEKSKKKKVSNSTHTAVERISIPQEKVDKFKKTLLYILSKVGGKPNVGQTVLYKLLYFIDFDYYEKYEEQLIGAKYIKNTHGPTPVAFAKIIEIGIR